MASRGGASGRGFPAAPPFTKAPTALASRAGCTHPRRAPLPGPSGHRRSVAHTQTVSMSEMHGLQGPGSVPWVVDFGGQASTKA